MKKFLLAVLFLASLLAPTTSAHDTLTELVYSTFLGGDLADEVAAITADSAGNLYVVGRTQSLQFPSQAKQTTSLHGVDAYVAKFDPTGSQLDYVLWFNALSASDVDEAYDIAIDGNGSAYVTGHTRSADFCTLFGDVPGYDTSYNNNGDAFVVKVRPDGSGLDYCTFLGGSDWDLGTAIALDAAGNAYVSGGTWSTDFPTTSSVYDETHNGLRDTFAAQLSPSGTTLNYATYIGGSSQEESRGLELDATGNLYLTGWTNSSDFPTTPSSYGPTHEGGFDGFVAKLDPTATTLIYGAYLGGTAEDRATDLAVTADGRATISGYTRSDDIWETADHQGEADLFAIQLTATGEEATLATLMGGSAEDQATGVALDAVGNIYLTGTTWSADLGENGRLNGTQDSFIIQLDAQGSPQQTQYLGGSTEERGGDLVITANSLFIAGDTRSSDFITTENAYDREHNGDYDIFVAKYMLPALPDPPTVYLPIMRR